jgi:CheY-like chemotaxis protein
MTLMHGASTDVNRTVLLVEDERDLALLISEILGTLPVQVTVARNGRDAIRIIESGQSFDLVLLDLVLPQVNGLEVLRRLRSISPDVKVIISTGYAQSLDPKDFTRLGISGFLSKPYMPNELVTAVRAVLWPDDNSVC